MHGPHNIKHWSVSIVWDRIWRYMLHSTVFFLWEFGKVLLRKKPQTNGKSRFDSGGGEAQECPSLHFSSRLLSPFQPLPKILNIRHKIESETDCWPPSCFLKIRWFSFSPLRPQYSVNFLYCTQAVLRWIICNLRTRNINSHCMPLSLLQFFWFLWPKVGNSRTDANNRFEHEISMSCNVSRKSEQLTFKEFLTRKASKLNCSFLCKEHC